MIAQVTFDGLARNASVEAAVQRWLRRLEHVRPIELCALSLHVEPVLFGLARRARAGLAVVAGRSAFDVTRVARLSHEDDVYALVSGAFREAHRRLTERTLVLAVS